MWFRFPQGAENISVNLQGFKTEVKEKLKDESGSEREWGFFRAPDHFAAQILDIPGFMALRPTGKDIPEDLPKSFPGDASVVAEGMAAQISALKEENSGLRDAIYSLTAERDKAVGALREALDQVAELKKVQPAPVEKK